MRACGRALTVLAAFRCLLSLRVVHTCHPPFGTTPRNVVRESGEHLLRVLSLLLVRRISAIVRTRVCRLRL